MPRTTTHWIAVALLLGAAGVLPAGEKPQPAPRPATPGGAGAAPTVAPADRVLEGGLYEAATGEIFTYTKELRGGRETVLYRRGDVVLDQQEMRRYEASAELPVIEPALAAAAAGVAPETGLPIIVWLRDRQALTTARQMRAAEMPAIESLGEEARAIRRAARPAGSLREAEEIAHARAAGGVLPPAEQASVRALGEEIERRTAVLREQIRLHLEAELGPGQEALAAVIEALGGEVTGRILSQNALTGWMPAGQLARLGADPRVGRVAEVPLGELELDNQGSSLGLTTGFWPDGVDGGIWDAGVLDTLVQQNHPNLDHVTYYTAPGRATTDSDGHGTGVAGIIYNDHATNRGMAFGLDGVLVGTCSAAGTPDAVIVDADWMVTTATDDPEAINLSCGYGRANTVDYSSFDQFWDGLIDDWSLLVGKSAGNGGAGTTTITHPAPAYNLLAVANVWDQNTTARSDDVRWTSSSRGPTLTGRKKPDIAAPGQNSLTTNNNWSTAADFTNLGGTSAAAPHVTGGAVLMTDLRSSDNPAANKAGLINAADAWTDGGTDASTADDGAVAGSEWNPTYGWGYLDLWEAWFNGPDVFTDTVDDGVTPPGPDFRLYTGLMFADEKATLVWNRHVGYNGTSFPTAVESLTDLDLIVYRADDGSFVGSSISSTNNVEQVAVPAATDYVVKVDVFGVIDPDVGVESFALATEENFTTAVPPGFTFAAPLLSAPPGQQVDWDVSVTNTGSVTAFGNSLDIALAPGFGIASGGDPQAIGDIPAGGQATGSWRLSAPCSTGGFFHNLTNTSSSYGEVLADAQVLGMSVGTTSLVDDAPVSSSQISRTFDFAVANFDWTAVGIDPRSTDRDVWGDDDQCQGSPYQTSTFAGTVRDFIIADGRDFGTSTHYAMITFGTSGTAYTVEADQATDVPVGGTSAQSFTASEVIETFETLLTAGSAYRIGVDVDSGGVDVGIFVYEASRSDGDRASNDFSAQSFGAGASEARTFVAGSSGLAGVVVTNDNAGSGNFTFTVDSFSGPTCDGIPAEIRHEVVSATLVLEDCDPFVLGPALRVAGSLTVRTGSDLRMVDGTSIVGEFAGEIDPALSP